MLRTIGWRIDDNVPWLAAPRGFSVRGEVWAAGAGERRLLSRVVEGLLGLEPGASRSLFEPVTLFHRVPAPRGEWAVEVWGHGLRLGVLELDPGGRWLLHASGALASLLERAGVESVEVTVRGRLKGKKIRLPADAEAVLVAAGRHVGWAQRVEGGVYRVRDLAPRGFRPLRASSLGDAARANRAYIERLAAEARGFIEREARGRKVYVAVSGGIDSSVAAVLAVEALGPERVTLVYADTGMEWPESRRTVERLADRLGVGLEVVSPTRDPLEWVADRGLMGRDNRWCTRRLKLEPLRRYYSQAKNPLVVEGVRAFESSVRARQPRRGFNPALGVERILPILYWTRLEVQLYAHLRGVEVSPLYEAGLVRIGCIACPAMTLHELRLARSLRPGFYQRLAQAVARACNTTVEEAMDWIMGGGWRRLGGCPERD